jgi:ribose transport system substrate-binding protein
MKAYRLTLAVVLSLAAFAAGCGSDDSSDSGGGGAAATQETTAAPKASKAVGETTGPAGEKATPTAEIKLTDDEVAKIKGGNHTAALVWHQSSDFVSAVTQGAKDEFARLGVKIVATTDAGFDAGKQKNDIETVMAKKPDAIITLPVDPAIAAAALKPAVKAGTKVVLLSNVPKGFKHGTDYTALVTDDLFSMGKQAADAMAAAIGGKGEIGYVFHDAEYYVTNQRDQAFKKTIEANYPDIKIVAEEGLADPNKAEDIANAMVTKNPNLKGIYVTWAEPAEGVLTALRNNGSTDTKIVTLDLSEPVGLDLAKGGNVAALVADQAYELGRALATSAGYGIIGKDAPEFAVAPAVTVTKANLAEGWQQSLHRDPPKTILDAAK